MAQDIYAVLVLVTGAWMVLGTVCYFWRLYRSSCLIRHTKDKYKNISKTNHLKQRYFTACENPECIRCHKYQQLRSEAYSCLTKYAEETEWTGLGRLLHSVKSGQSMANEGCSQQPNVLYIDNLLACPIWRDPVQFQDDLYSLEQNIETISWEFSIVRKNITDASSGWIRNSTSQGEWSVYSLYNQGCKMQNNCKHCPKTTAIIESLPHFMNRCVFGNACFSVMSPQTYIDEHYGPTNARIRCHLGLQVPDSGDCHLTVNGEKQPWKRGKCIIFDDSFLHSASNSTKDVLGYRAVLMLDFWHPDLSDLEIKAMEHVF